MPQFFPLSDKYANVHTKELHNAVERLMKEAYQPGQKRDRDAFEREVFVS